MKKNKKPLELHDLHAQVHDMHELQSKFRYSNLDKDICKAIIERYLWIATVKAYIKPHNVHFRDASYNVHDCLIFKYHVDYTFVDDDEETRNKDACVWVYVPMQFLKYSFIAPYETNPSYIIMSFKYSQKDFKKWIKEKRAKLVESRKSELEKQIKNLQAALAQLT
jgi:hypothetical protein